MVRTLARRLAPLLLPLFAMLLPAHAARANALGLQYIETPELKLIYFDSLGFMAPYAVRTFTNAMAWQRRHFGWQPSEPPAVLLKDFADYGNAAVWAAPRNTLFFDIAPLSHAYETYPASERMYSLMNHELVHVASNDVADATDRFWRRAFRGKVAPRADNPESLLYGYLTVPRFHAPRWWLEGTAVFLETWMGGGIGRAQGGYDEMVFRTMVRDGQPFFDPLGLESRGVRVDFQVGANAYLYGTRFLTWLGLQHGPDKVLAWMRRDAGSRRHYADQFAHVFGLPLDTAWQQWVAFEQDFQRRNLASVRAQPVTPHQVLTPTALGSISRLAWDETTATLLGAFRYQGFVEHVGALDTRSGRLRRLADIKGAMLYRVASFAWDAESRTAFYTDDNVAWRDLMAVDVDSGATRRLIEDGRIGELAFSRTERALYGIRHGNGVATLVRIAAPYTVWEPLHTWPYGVVPYDLDVSPDGTRLSASVSEVGGVQFVRVWELAKLRLGDAAPLSEFRFGQSVPECFVFSPDGRYLYGSSYYTGVSNIFRYEVASGTIEAVSNAETGYFRPLPLADGRLVVLNYTGAGFVPVVIEPRVLASVGAIRFLGNEVAERHPAVTTWQVPPPSTVDETKLVVRQGEYDPPRELELVNAYPVLQGYKAYAGAGYRLNWEDRLRFASLSVTAAVTPSTSLDRDERFHLDAKWSYLGWRAELGWNRSDFYDLFGPTLRSRRGFAAIGGYDHLLLYDEPRKLELKTEVAYYDKLDALPAAQNVGATFERLVAVESGLHYSDLRKSLGGVDEAKGWAWNVVAAVQQAGGDAYPSLRGDLAVGTDLPLAHSSLWLRAGAGLADGDRASPYTNFYFGGFGNNYVDRRAVKRYRELESLPGFEINEIAGRSFARTQLEWNLPPARFESLGTPAFHLKWLRPALFATQLWTDPADGARRARFGSVGAQFDLSFTVLHWYDMTLSFGYATGYRGSRRNSDEWMLSLKIM